MAKREHQNDLGEVRACDCGGVNLTMGPMTLHISAEELPLLQELIDAAVDLEPPPTPDPEDTREEDSSSEEKGTLH